MNLVLIFDIKAAKRWRCRFYDQCRSELILCHINSRLSSLPLLLLMEGSPIYLPSIPFSRKNITHVSYLYSRQKCRGIYADAKMMLYVLQSINCLAAPPPPPPSLLSLPAGKVVHCSRQIPSDGPLLYLSPTVMFQLPTLIPVCVMNAACPNMP